jgi:hypothetical protein
MAHPVRGSFFKQEAFSMDFKLTTTRAVPLDPRASWEQTATQIAAMRCRELPPDTASDLVKPLWRTLDAALAEIFKRGNYSEADAAFNAFDTALATAVGKEYERVRAAATNNVEALLGVLEAHGWFAKEQAAARQLVVAPERLERVDFFALTTNRRKISRDELRAFGRPTSWTNDSSWNAQFVSDRNVRELQDEAARRERELRIPPGSDSRNMDLPDPRR